VAAIVMIFLRINSQISCSLKSIKANQEWNTRSFV